jgi:hypothetical protein
VADIRRCLLFMLSYCPPFSRHEPFTGRLLFGKLHRDINNVVGNGRIHLLEDDGAHFPSGRILVRRLKEADEGGL